jgi:hypothetical protein
MEELEELAEGLVLCALIACLIVATLVVCGG